LRVQHKLLEQVSLEQVSLQPGSHLHVQLLSIVQLLLSRATSGSVESRQPLCVVTTAHQVLYRKWISSLNVKQNNCRWAIQEYL